MGPTATKSSFRGPWSLPEILADEFAYIETGSLPATATATSKDRAHWQISADDIASTNDALERRLAEIGFRKTIATANALPGGSGSLDTSSALDVLSVALDTDPSKLVSICDCFLSSSEGRAFAENAPKPTKSPDEDAPIRWRFNRGVLELTFRGLIQTVDNRELAKLFAKPAVPRTDGGARDPGHRWALCISGGGIRSASFSLGVIQGLARHRLLDRFDYVSTVSGGGYVGSWLSAWRSRNGYKSLEAELRATAGSPLDPEAAPVRYLRAYSRYLSPHRGFFTTDMWTVIATIFRNLLLNWLVILPIVAAVLTIPILAFAIVAAPSMPSVWLGRLTAAFFIAGIVLGAIGVWFVHSRRPDTDASGVDKTKKDTAQSVRTSGQRAFVVWCLLPICLSIGLINTAWYWLRTVDGVVAQFPGMPDPSTPQIVWYAFAFGASIHFLGWLGAQFFGEADREPVGPKMLRELAYILFTGGVAGAAAVKFADFVLGLATDAAHGTTRAVVLARMFADFPALLHVGSLQPVLYTMLAFPGFLTGLVLAGFLYVGITSADRFDGEREWSSRYSAWLLMVIVVWLGLSTVVMTSVAVIAHFWGVVGTFITGAATGGATAAVGYSAHSQSKAATTNDGKKDEQPLAMRIVTAFAVPIAILAILILLAGMNASIIGLAMNKFPDYRLEVIGAYAAALVGLGLWFSRQIDVNKFSLHAMYRSRLIRAYLGASRRPEERHPNPMTGFDSQDNFPVEPLLPATPLNTVVPRDKRAPIHLLNIALNLTSSTTLAWQDRQARSFTVSPLHAGSWGLGYRRTRAFNDDDDAYYGGVNGIQLGTAMAISGAAASPNMGYNSSKTVTFLMTMFNARLGWWLGNPGWAGRDKCHDANPSVSISPIFRELLGLTSDRHSLVHLSDGGHFENLGLYEMVLRRCRVIVVADASCDRDFAFDDLGRAIRQIRIDFGIPIDFREDPHDLKPPPDRSGSTPHSHWATAKIRYSEVDPNQPDGYLVYLKPKLGGDEPQDVEAYERSSDGFPHEATSDQFFSESQLESYRSLGVHTVADMFRGSAPGSVLLNHRENGTVL